MSVKELDKIYGQIAAEIRAQYYAGLRSNTSNDGRWRKVDVTSRARLEGYKDSVSPGISRTYQKPLVFEGFRARVEAEAGKAVPEPFTQPSALSPSPFQLRMIDGCYALGLRPLQPRVRLPAAGDQKRAIGELTEGWTVAIANSIAGRHRVWQDVHDGADDRTREPADAGDGPTRRSPRSSTRVPLLLPENAVG